MKVEFRNIYGNQRLKNVFSDHVVNGTLVHAMIFEGVSGSGKMTFALNLAAAMNCRSEAAPCYSCKSCKRIFDLKSPDIKIISLEENHSTITVDSIREIRQSAARVPCELDYKMYIIENSDKMTVQAQNAILKILEEPPSFIYFILLCENSNSLLPTIKSRAPVFRMQHFTDRELTEYLLTHFKEAKSIFDKDPEKFAKQIKNARGSIGTALSLMNRRAFDAANKRNEKIITFFDSLVSSKKSDFFANEDLMPSKREELSQFFSDMITALRDIILSKKSSDAEFVFFENNAVVSRYASKITLKALMDIYSISNIYAAQNERNANMNIQKITYLSAIWSIIHD